MVDWKRLSREAGLRPGYDGTIDVALDGGRHQKVSVEVAESGATFIRVWSTVAGRTASEKIEDLARGAWFRNKSVDMVGFRTDEDGRLLGESRVPIAGLTSGEWAVYVRAVARACDRLEFLLTGRDFY